MALAEHSHDVLATKCSNDLNLRAGRLDHLNHRLNAIIGEREMFRPHAVHCCSSFASASCYGERESRASWPLKFQFAISPQGTFEEIHRR